MSTRKRPPRYEEEEKRPRRTTRTTSQSRSRSNSSSSSRRKNSTSHSYDEDFYDSSTKRRSSTSKSNTKKRKKKKKRKMRLLLFLEILIILVALLYAAYYFVFSKMQTDHVNMENVTINHFQDDNINHYKTIALFGLDSQDNDFGEGNRSDAMIIASINNDTKEVKLISVYRDTYVNIEGHGLDKITHAYSYGEAPLAIKTLNENFDLNITEFATVNFDAVAEAINALGGVTIDVQPEEVKYINSYIDETSKVTGLTTEKVKSSGAQTLDGVQAVAYSRIRYTEGGDYKRAERMRTVVQAMVEKFKTKSIGEMNQIIDKVLPEVYTNITASDIFSLLPSVASFKVTDSIGWPYETKGITLDRWYGVPVTLESNVKKLHEEAFGETDYVPSDRVKEISNQIIEKTGYTN